MAQSDKELSETFKGILSSLYEAFPEESNELNVYKSVARMEKKTQKLLDYVPGKFEQLLKNGLDLLVEENSTENLSPQKDDVEESINDSVLKIREDLKKLKKTNKEIIKKESKLKILNEFMAEDNCTNALREIENAQKSITEEPSSS